MEILRANTDELVSKAKDLFQEYAASLGFDLSFQDFDAELECFPAQYSLPSGDLFIARLDAQSIGCVGVRFLEEGICEMKRLYVRPEFRGNHTGRKLGEAAIQAGKNLGYERMRLDTLSSMEIANELYKSLGFTEIEPYRHNPLEGVLYLELDLTK